jgi:hypothetical protein
MVGFLWLFIYFVIDDYRRFWELKFVLFCLDFKLIPEILFDSLDVWANEVICELVYRDLLILLFIYPFKPCFKFLSFNKGALFSQQRM